MGTSFEDVNRYLEWSDVVSATHALSVVDTSQKPLGAAFVLMIPRLVGDYATMFVA